MKNKRRKKQGFTLIETLFSAFIMLFVITVGASVYLLGMESWYRGESNISAQEGAQQGMQNVISLLREAIYVNIDANGKDLTFNLPQENASGTITVPTLWDGISRRIEVQGNQLIYTWDGGPVEVLANNLSFTDPLSPGGLTPVTLFVPGTGAVTRSMTIMVVEKTSAPNTTVPVFGRRREVIYLRNVPGLLN